MDPKDPAYKMYQEMLTLMRDYSDRNTQLPSEDPSQDPLSTNFEAEFN